MGQSPLFSSRLFIHDPKTSSNQFIYIPGQIPRQTQSLLTQDNTLYYVGGYTRASQPQPATDFFQFQFKTGLKQLPNIK